MNPLHLLHRYYPPGTPGHAVLATHSALVAERATDIARRLARRGEATDVEFIRQAAWLHDIGILRTDAPELGCSGALPYICHGIAGRQMLEAEGLLRHALVCERHIGVGLTAEDIRQQELPLPQRDMQPRSMEERIVAYADLFFSKNPRRNAAAKTVEEVRRSLMRHGADKVALFDRWHQRFGG